MLIKIVSELISRYSTINEDPRQQFTKVSQISDYLKGLFVGKSVERVYLLLFNNSMRLIKTILVGDGTVNMATLRPQMLMKPAIMHNASYAVLAHNHPSGLAIPSSEDISTSYMLKSAFAHIDVTMLDHFLVADGKCIPIIRAAEKNGIGGEIDPQSHLLKSAEFKIEDDYECDLINFVE